MTYTLVKLAITAILIVAISEISRRSTLIAAILASIPLISVFAIIWLYHDTKDINKISELSMSIFWLVLPSLLLFVSLPILLTRGFNFYLSLTISIALTAFCYFLMIVILERFGMPLYDARNN